MMRIAEQDGGVNNLKKITKSQTAFPCLQARCRQGGNFDFILRRQQQRGGLQCERL